MSTLSINNPTSFEWMIIVGISSDDVQWMECMRGSLALHQPQNSIRVARIYEEAISALLQNPSRNIIMEKIIKQ